jgi:uncharacterized protein YaaW (UPF0174 family)
MQYAGKKYEMTYHRERETSLMERRLERQLEEQRLEMLKKRVQKELSAASAGKEAFHAA